MGKFQSKHAAAAFKRRESPEGDSFVVSAYTSGRRGVEEVERRGGCAEHSARDKQALRDTGPPRLRVHLGAALEEPQVQVRGCSQKEDAGAHGHLPWGRCSGAGSSHGERRGPWD
nr:protein naked cuticle homolog 2-like [Camelus dromedarius]